MILETYKTIAFYKKLLKECQSIIFLYWWARKYCYEKNQANSHETVDRDPNLRFGTHFYWVKFLKVIVKI